MSSLEIPLLPEAVPSVENATLILVPAPARAAVTKPRSAAAPRRTGTAALLVSVVAALVACQSGKVPEPTKEAKPATPAPAATPTAVGSSGAAVDKAAADKAAAEKAAAERPRLREPVFQKVQAKP